MDQSNSNSKLNIDLGELYAKVVETTEEGIVCVKADGYIGFANEAFCRLTGYEVAEICQMKLADLLSPESLASYRARADKRKAGRLREQYELVYVHKKTGKHVSTLSCVSPITGKNGELLFSMGVITNITQMKELQAELGQTIQKLKSAQNVARLGFWEHDIASDEYRWSDELFAMFGMRPSEIGMTNKQLFAMVHPQDAPKLIELNESAYKLGIPYATRFRLTKTDGSMICVYNIADVEKDREGRVVRLLGICQDVTDQAERENIINEQRTQMIASSKFSALGEMAGGVAHEIITPLAAIQMRAERLLERIAQGEINKDSVIESLEVVVKTTTKVAKIINDLRAFSRQSDGDPVVSIPVQTVIENSLSFCREKFKSYGVHLEVDAIPPELSVNCQPTQVARVLLNLLSNAFDAVENASSPWVRIEARNAQGFVEICVVDSGTAIAKDAAQMLFMPFFTTKAVGKGAGLGLSTSRGLMEIQNGDLTFDQNRPNTCFVMRLPKSKAAMHKATG